MNIPLFFVHSKTIAHTKHSVYKNIHDLVEIMLNPVRECLTQDRQQFEHFI